MASKAVGRLYYWLELAIYTWLQHCIPYKRCSPSLSILYTAFCCYILPYYLITLMVILSSFHSRTLPICTGESVFVTAFISVVCWVSTCIYGRLRTMSSGSWIDLIYSIQEGNISNIPHMPSHTGLSIRRSICFVTEMNPSQSIYMYLYKWVGFCYVIAVTSTGYIHIVRGISSKIYHCCLFLLTWSNDYWDMKNASCILFFAFIW